MRQKASAARKNLDYLSEGFTATLSQWDALLMMMMMWCREDGREKGGYVLFVIRVYM